jgi:hypothetical protein
MLDQNTTTVLTTLITVFGTLGGVVLGVVLSNRYVARQEKAKRNTAVIEEVYTLFEKINGCVTKNISTKRSCLDGTEEYISRAQTLIYLYLPSLKEEITVFIRSLEELTVEVYEAQLKNKPDKVWEIVHVAYEDYRKHMLAIRSSLEKMVK